MFYKIISLEKISCEIPQDIETVLNIETYDCIENYLTPQNGLKT